MLPAHSLLNSAQSCNGSAEEKQGEETSGDPTEGRKREREKERKHAADL